MQYDDGGKMETVEMNASSKKKKKNGMFTFRTHKICFVGRGRFTSTQKSIGKKGWSGLRKTVLNGKHSEHFNQYPQLCSKKILGYL